MSTFRLFCNMIISKRLMPLTRQLHVKQRLHRCQTMKNIHGLKSWKMNRTGSEQGYRAVFESYVPVLVCTAVIAAKVEAEEDGELVKSVKLAVLSMQRGELDKAELLLHLSLRMAQEQVNAPAISYVYSLMANVALRQQRFAKAERLLLELSRRLAATAGTDDNAFVEVSLKLANVYAAVGDAPRADAGFRYCVDTQQRKIDAVGEQHADEDTLGLWGMSADAYARFLAERGQVVRARQLTERALAVSVRLSGEHGPQSLVLLSDVAALDSLCGDHEQAAGRLARAVELAKRHDHDDLASFYVNLGMVQIEQGLLREAGAACRSGQRLARRRDDKTTLDMAAKCLEKLKTMR